MLIWNRFRRSSALIRRLAQDRRGATLIEFAFCSAAFMAMLLGAAQIALIYFAQQGIQTSAEKMARQLMTGESGPRPLPRTSSKRRLRDAAELHEL